ncbi:MAG: hypothetical protein KatS3mg057_1988 [Herpetosiphonaceae bacterium]|nr:MAG: hypothetical protein KatS3mg057_1988 [Herpetosiphonaceae bacterium]
MPGSPEKQSQSVSTAVGPIDLHMFTLDLGTSAYMVSFSDYPAEVITAAGPDAVLDGAAGGAISNVNGTVLNEREISISGYPGREIEVQIPKTAENDEGTAKARIYLVDARLYQVLVLGTKGKLSTEDADRFLNSFKLTSN